MFMHGCVSMAWMGPRRRSGHDTRRRLLSLWRRMREWAAADGELLVGCTVYTCMYGYMCMATCTTQCWSAVGFHSSVYGGVAGRRECV